MASYTSNFIRILSLFCFLSYSSFLFSQDQRPQKWKLSANYSIDFLTGSKVLLDTIPVIHEVDSILSWNDQYFNSWGVGVEYLFNPNWAVQFSLGISVRDYQREYSFDKFSSLALIVARDSRKLRYSFNTLSVKHYFPFKKFAFTQAVGASLHFVSSQGDEFFDFKKQVPAFNGNLGVEYFFIERNSIGLQVAYSHLPDNILDSSQFELKFNTFSINFALSVLL